MRICLLFFIFYVAAISGAYDPTEFDIQTIYINGNTKHSRAQGTEHKRALWFAWNHSQEQKNPEIFFMKRYIEIHNTAVFESYRRRNRLKVSDAVKKQYRLLLQEGGMLFAEIELFRARAEGSESNWFTALLQAAGIPLVGKSNANEEAVRSVHASAAASDDHQSLKSEVED